MTLRDEMHTSRHISVVSIMDGVSILVGEQAYMDA